MGRLFLFAQKQGNNTDDYQTKLEQLRICNHQHHPLSRGVANRLPFATASEFMITRAFALCKQNAAPALAAPGGGIDIFAGNGYNKDKGTPPTDGWP